MEQNDTTTERYDWGHVRTTDEPIADTDELPPLPAFKPGGQWLGPAV